jgi:hypothetical protein
MGGSNRCGVVTTHRGNAWKGIPFLETSIESSPSIIALGDVRQRE